MLRWARERANYEVDDVAYKMNTSVDVIIAWESGVDSPTYVQLEKHTFKIYHRPVELFFFPEPPQEE